MTEIFVIEKMVALGLWELVSNKAYKNLGTAINDCDKLINFMQQNVDKSFAARVTKLLINMD